MTISMVFARSVIAEFERRNLDTSELLALSGLTLERLYSGAPMLAYEESSSLVRLAARLSGDDGIGLAAGLGTPATALKMVSLLVLSQPDLRAAIRVFEHYMRLVSDGPAYALVERDDVALWTLMPAVPQSDVTRMMVDYALAVTARIASALVGVTSNDPNNPLLLQVRFQHDATHYEARYREAYGCPILFGQDVNALVFRRDLLDHPLSHGDQAVVAAARGPAEQMLRAANQDGKWMQRVQFLLEHTESFVDVDGASLAQRLHVNERSLRRRLERESTSLGALLDDARCRKACEALRSSNVSLSELGARLGFSTTSAFGRAFRAWTGHTPASYRRDYRTRSKSGPLRVD